MLNQAAPPNWVRMFSVFGVNVFTVLSVNVFTTVLYIGNHSGNDYFGLITANFLEINKRGDSRVPEEDEEIN